MSRSSRPTTRRRAATALAAVGVAASAFVAATTTANATPSQDIVYSTNPHQTRAAGLSRSTSAFPSPSQCLAKYGLVCYTASEIRKAYDIPDGWTGKGQKIAIVDAYGSPTAAADLAVFSKAMGLPQADFHVYCPQGCPASTTAHKDLPPNWSGETSLDVQWAHAIAPDAQINLVVATGPSGNTINNAIKYAVDNDLGDVVSMSFSSSEAVVKGSGGANNTQIQQAHKAFEAASAKGIELFASSGDDGATDGQKVVSAGYPASDPLVTSVGGTNLYTADDGTYQYETVWGDQANCPLTCEGGPVGATGGAPSVIFPAPAWQKPATGLSMRATSDVALDASTFTAVLVYEGFHASDDDNSWYFVGGTSSSAPQWAAIAALANEQAGHRIGDLNPKLYATYGTAAYARDFHDITSGNNAWNGPGYDAKVGWDFPTGLGSPDVRNLVGTLTGK